MDEDTPSQPIIDLAGTKISLPSISEIEDYVLRIGNRIDDLIRDANTRDFFTIEHMSGINYTIYYYNYSRGVFEPLGYNSEELQKILNCTSRGSCKLYYCDRMVDIEGNRIYYEATIELASAYDNSDDEMSQRSDISFIVDESDDESSVVEPNVVEPNVVEPNVVEPNIVEPNVVEPNIQNVFLPRVEFEKLYEDPHNKTKITIRIFDTRGKKTLDASTDVNILQYTDFDGSIKDGIITVDSGSVADVTRAIGKVFKIIFERLNIVTQDLSKKNYLVETIKFLDEVDLVKGRVGVSTAYKTLYDRCITNLNRFKDELIDIGLSLDILNSIFISISGVKAILDSAPLSDTVLDIIKNKLSPCYDKLYFNDQTRIDTYMQKIRNPFILVPVSDPANEKKNIQEFIQFWTEIEYCRVFQLVSSDILGAVNGLLILRTIIETTGFTGFITIPKGNGGQVGVDNKVCVYALFLESCLFGINPKERLFVNVDKSLYSLYTVKIKEFTQFLLDSKEFLSISTQTVLTDVYYSLTKLLERIKGIDGLKGGIFRNLPEENSDLFPAAYNIFKIIVFFKAFINKNIDFFNSIIDKVDYEEQNFDHALNTDSRITWLCFQLTRHEQVDKFIPVEQLQYGDDFFSNLETRRLQFRTMLEDCETNYVTQMCNATQKVFVNESFGGHDNKSNDLSLAAVKAIMRSVLESIKNPTQMSKMAKTKSKPQTKGFFEEEEVEVEVEGEDEVISSESTSSSSKNTVVDNISVFNVPDSYKPGWLTEKTFGGKTYSPMVNDDVIRSVLKESKCVFLSDVILPDVNRCTWILGKECLHMLVDRKFKDITLPVSFPTVEFLNIITGPRSYLYKIDTVVDLAKYLPEQIIIDRSQDLSTELIGSTISGKVDTDFIDVSNTDLTNTFLNSQFLDNTSVSNVIHVPISTAIDRASFKFTNSSVYTQGKTKKTLNPGNNLTMLIEFCAGIDDSYEPKLCTRGKVVECSFGKTDKDVCLQFFCKKGPSKEIVKILNEKKKNFSFPFENIEIQPKKPRKAVSSENESDEDEDEKEDKGPAMFTYGKFLKLLSENNNNNDLRVFLKTVIPLTQSLNSASLFTKGSNKGSMFEEFIFSIAQDSGLIVASSVIKTILTIQLEKQMPDVKEDRIQKCLSFLKENLDFIGHLQAKMPMNPTSYPLMLILSEFQQKISNSPNGICIYKKLPNGNTVLDFVDIDEMFRNFQQEQDEIFSIAVNLVNPTKRKPEVNVTPNSLKEKISILYEQLNRVENFLINDVYKLNDVEVTSSNVKLYLKYKEKLKETEQELEVLLTEDLVSNLLKKQKGLEGGGKSLDEINEELIQLELDFKALIFPLITYTSEPITELESWKTAIILGPELFKEFMFEPERRQIEELNKAFIESYKLKFPFLGEEIPIEKIIIDDKSIKLDELVSVEVINGEYHITKPDLFINSIFEGLESTLPLETTLPLASTLPLETTFPLENTLPLVETSNLPLETTKPLLETTTKPSLSRSFSASGESALASAAEGVIRTASAAAAGGRKLTKKKLNKIKKNSIRKNKKKHSSSTSNRKTIKKHRRYKKKTKRTV
jgi:hypothetical protein